VKEWKEKGRKALGSSRFFIPQLPIRSRKTLLMGQRKGAGAGGYWKGEWNGI